MQIELTEDERDFLACILYHTVAGDPDGPRQHADNILQKLHGKNCNRFAIGIELPTEFIESVEVLLWVHDYMDKSPAPADEVER